MHRFTTRALIAASLLALAACASGGSDGGASPSASASANQSPSGAPSASLLLWAEPAMVPALEVAATQHLNATGVEVIVQPKELDELRGSLPTLAPQGQGPDLFVGQSDWVGEFVDGGLLAPVDLAGQASQFRPVSVAGFRYNSRDYGVPISTENLALFRNTDLAPQPPQTIEEMAALGLKLKKAKEADLPIALPVGPTGDAYHWYPMYSAAGGYLFGQNPDGSYSPESVGVGEEGSIRAAQALADLTERGALDPEVTLGDAIDAFTAGRAPYFISGPWAVQPVRDAGIPYVVEAIPGFAATTRPLTQSLVTSKGLMLSAFARDAAAAQEFLTTTAMSTATMDALHAATGEVPAWAASFSVAAADPAVKAFGDFADASVPTPNLAVMADTWVALSQAQVDVMGAAGPARTMRSAGDEIRAAIDAG